MNPPRPETIFNVNNENFETAALEMFQFQLQHNAVYGQYVASLPTNKQNITALEQVPFLPVGFFKTHPVKSFDGHPQIEFLSSGTSGMINSRHPVKDLSIYEESFITCFKRFYGDPSKYAFLCLLPAYMEREGSSLIYMAEKLIQLSRSPDSGFFLHAKGTMADTLNRRERNGKPTFVLGVTIALLDFAAENSLHLSNTIVMETGGMKGRRKEITRMEVHQALQNSFAIDAVHSEYGMTELLSQAYSGGAGIFKCPPWMRVLVRDEDDPFAIKTSGRGILCIIDLANIYSCSFIETADMGMVYDDGSFEVLGRIDNSDIRGCSLLVT